MQLEHPLIGSWKLDAFAQWRFDGYDAEDSDFLAFAARVTREAPEPLAGRVPGVTRDLSDVVLRMLEKSKDDRYQAALDAARALSRRLAGGTGSDPVSRQRDART